MSTWPASENSTTGTSVSMLNLLCFGLYHSAVPSRSICCTCLEQKGPCKLLVWLADDSVAIGHMSRQLWCYMQGGRSLRLSLQMPWPSSSLLALPAQHQVQHSRTADSKLQAAACLPPQLTPPVRQTQLPNSCNRQPRISQDSTACTAWQIPIGRLSTACMA